jgi:GTP-binding protein
MGTIAKDTDTGEIIAEVLEEGVNIPLVKGGRGGKGNDFFKTATRQTPRFSQTGEPGEERNISMELKLLADVGLVGLPNAGNSTHVSSLTTAKPKIADYPFTTLVPSLGVVKVGDYQNFVIADIPGIIEGAHEGKGLGTQFLKHIERNALLLFLIPVTTEDPGAEYRTLLGELEGFNPRMLQKPRAVAITKMDLIAPDKRDKTVAKAVKSIGKDVTSYAISSVARIGLEELRMGLWARVQESRSFDSD